MSRQRIDDFDLHYFEAGSGPPLVFLHGLGGRLEDWDQQLAHFAQAYRVIAPDLRGFGLSARGRRRYSVAQLATDLSMLLEALEIRTFLLVGHSMGGAVAQQFALTQPQRVERLVLANTVPSFRPQAPRHYFELGYRLLLMSLLGPGVLAMIGGWRQFPGPEQAEQREKNIARGKRNRRWSYLHALLALSGWSVIEKLEQLNMPVLVIASEHDYFTRAETLAFAQALPRARLHTFKSAHHGLPAEQPEPFNAVLGRFLTAPIPQLRRRRDRVIA